MQTESCSQFESAIFRHIAAGTADDALRAQLENVQVASRKYTGVGCYSNLVPAESAPATQDPYGSHGPLQGPDFESACVKYGGGTLLWFKDGRVNSLEIYANGDFFPENHADLVPFTIADVP
jgi:hypothetical protein